MRARTGTMIGSAAVVLALLVSAACGSSSEPRSGGRSTQHAGPPRGFVTVDPGVRIHYLDYGGAGPALVFLAGGGNGAHVFDTFAPRFTDDFHVLALTRRGFGESSQPKTGYDTSTLADDIGGVLDGLAIHSATLVGHSLAGAEMTRFAVDHPERVDRLVFLDAAYDWAAAAKAPNPAPPPTAPQPTEAQLSSPAAFSSYVAWTQGLSTFPEADVRATNRFDDGDGAYVAAVTPPEIGAAVGAGVAARSPEYARLRCPVLAIYKVDESPTDMFPWLTSDSPQLPAAEAYFPAARASLAAQRASFKAQVPTATVVELAGVSHYLFLARPGEVATTMDAFIGGSG